MKYRIVYEKQPGFFYIQELGKYRSWFGFGIEKEKWNYIEKYYFGSDYHPVSADYYDRHSFNTLKDAKKRLKKLIEKDKLNSLEVVYER